MDSSLEGSSTAQVEINKMIGFINRSGNRCYIYEDHRIEWQGHLICLLREKDIEIKGYVTAHYDEMVFIDRDIENFILDDLSHNDCIIINGSERRHHRFINCLRERGFENFYIVNPLVKQVLREVYKSSLSKLLDAYHRVFIKYNWQADIDEITKMVEFARDKKRLYIFGISERTEMLLKFFDTASVKIDGFVRF